MVGRCAACRPIRRDPGCARNMPETVAARWNRRRQRVVSGAGRWTGFEKNETSLFSLRRRTMWRRCRARRGRCSCPAALRAAERPEPSAAANGPRVDRAVRPQARREQNPPVEADRNYAGNAQGLRPEKHKDSCQQKRRAKIAMKSQGCLKWKKPHGT